MQEVQSNLRNLSLSLQILNYKVPNLLFQFEYMFYLLFQLRSYHLSVYFGCFVPMCFIVLYFCSLILLDLPINDNGSDLLLKKIRIHVGY